MKKIKFLIASMLGAIALVFACVLGTRVNATVDSTDNTKASWNRSDRADILQSNKASGVTYSTASSWNDCSTFDIKNTIILIPVPQSSEGTIYIKSTQTNASKKVTLLSSSGSNTTTTVEMNKNEEESASFDSGNIINHNNSGKYYIGFTDSGTDCKIDTIRIVLETGAYVSQVELSYYLKGSDSSFYSIKINSGSSYTPLAYKWGYDITGYYTDSNCSTEWNNSSAINSDTSIYCTFSAWNNKFGDDGYTFPNSSIVDAKNCFGEQISDVTVSLTNSIYVLSQKVSFTTQTIDEEVFNVFKVDKPGVENGAVSKTIIVNATEAGVLKIEANGNNNERSVSLYPTALKSGELDSAINTSEDKTVKKGKGIVNIIIPAAGSYCIGFSGSANVFSLEFTPYISNSATTTVDVEKSGDEVRFITTVSGVEIANIKSLELVLWKNEVLDENKNANNLQMTTLYTSVINASKTYAGGTNIYYGIVKISDVSKLKTRSINTLCFNVIVTFQDNSTKSMDNNLEFDL